MFIAAGSDFSGGKVWDEKRVAETQTAAQTRAAACGITLSC